MIIKHLYKNDTHVANAFLHKRNATVDIKWLDDTQGADTTIEFHELEDYKHRFELLAEDERGQGRLFI